MRDGRARAPSLPDRFAEGLVVRADDGVELRLYRVREAPAEGPVLLWGHANGFPAGGYLPLLRRLCRDYRVFAFDARGHGGSGLPDVCYAAHFTFDRYAGDLRRIFDAVAERTGGAPLHYGAHSFCGVLGLRLAGVHGHRPWRSMTAFEPPVCPGADHPARSLSEEASRSLMAMAGRRRARWASPEAFRESLAGRDAYAAFDPEALAGHAFGALHGTGEGDFALACPPELEALTYEGALDPSTYECLDRIRAPVTFVACRSDGGRGGNPSWAAKVQASCADRVPSGRLVMFDGAGHMVPFEDPERCAAVVREMADAG